jgi:ribose transport system substrate-binding protein
VKKATENRGLGETVISTPIHRFSVFPILFSKEILMKKFLILFSCLILTAFCLNCDPASKTDGYTVAVIPKGTTHEFWKSIHAGAIKAQQEFAAQGVKVNVIWKGPLKEDDREQQIQVVENFRSQNVSGIVLAPLDNKALVRPVEEAQQSKIPTVIIDSGLESNAIVSFVATDNLKGGSLAADRLGTLLQGRGKVLLLRYQQGSASTEDREKGFSDRMKSQYPGIEVFNGDVYAGATRETAFQASQNLLNRFGNDIQGVFTPNESATAGMQLALSEANKTGKIRHVGFDATDKFVEAMRKKELDGIVVQDPFKMGYLGVKTMVEHLQGKAIEKRVDTGVILITPDNLDDAGSQTLLHPPLDQYLK